MNINIDDKWLSGIFKDTDPYDFFWLYENTEELMDFIKSDYRFYLFNGEDGKLVFHCHNVELEPTGTDVIFTEYSTMKVPFSKVADQYIDNADGSYSIEHMKNHANQLRDFASRIEKRCKELESE